MPEDDPLHDLHARLTAEAAEEEFVIDDRAIRELHVGLMEALYYQDVLFSKSPDRDWVSSYKALHTMIRFVQAHDQWRDASRPLVLLESALHDLEHGQLGAMLRPRPRAVDGGPSGSWHLTMLRGYTAGVMGGLMKHNDMSRNEAAEWVSKKLRRAGRWVAPNTVIYWRRNALNHKRSPDLHDAYRTVIDAAAWTSDAPLACAEQLVAKLIALHRKRRANPLCAPPGSWC
jgi:hypothetical protein